MEMLIKDVAKLFDEAVRENAFKLYKEAQARHKDLQTYYEKGTLLTDLDKPIANYCAYITDVATGYFLGKPVRYTINDQTSENTKQSDAALNSSKTDTDNEIKTPMDQIQEVLDMNDEPDHNKTIGTDESVHGETYELCYMDEEAKFRFTDLRPWEVVMVYNMSADKKKIGAFRFLKQKDYTSANAEEKIYCFLYHETGWIEYEQQSGKFVEIDKQDHPFAAVPVIAYSCNKETIGDFERVITLINTYNASQAMTKVDMENFTNALLILIGQMGTTTGDLKKIKEDGVATMGVGGDAKWLTKEINDAFIENFKDRLRKDIHTISKTPDLTDESFGGQQTGVAMEFKLWGLEQLTSTKESKFKAGLKERLSLIARILSIRGEQFDVNEIEIQFSRNIPASMAELVTTLSGLKGLVSDETLLSQIPFVQDPAAEIEKTDAAKEKAMEQYGFGMNGQPGKPGAPKPGGKPGDQKPTDKKQEEGK